jgi:hypothetical protein
MQKSNFVKGDEVILRPIEELRNRMSNPEVRVVLNHLKDNPDYYQVLEELFSPCFDGIEPHIEVVTIYNESLTYRVVAVVNSARPNDEPFWMPEVFLRKKPEPESSHTKIMREINNDLLADRDLSIARQKYLDTTVKSADEIVYISNSGNIKITSFHQRLRTLNNAEKYRYYIMLMKVYKKEELYKFVWINKAIHDFAREVVLTDAQRLSKVLYSDKNKTISITMTTDVVTKDIEFKVRLDEKKETFEYTLSGDEVFKIIADFTLSN